MNHADIRDSLEYYWVISSDENKLVLPQENCIVSSNFHKKNGDSSFECELHLFKNLVYLTSNKQVIGLINFSFELTFEMIINRDDENQVENIKNGKFSGLKFEKDECECEFVAVNQKDYQIWKSHLAKFLTQKNFYSYYEVIRVIGSGANSSVVIANNKIDGKQYAVKSLSKAHIYSAENGKAEIENELNLMRQVHHENIMQLYEVFDADTSIKIVLELVQGGQLLDAIKQNPHLSWNSIGKIMYQILSGLKVIHSHNIMHRDLKPENILMKNKKELDLVIADFGLSTKADIPKYLYLKCGTPGYVAPEVINLPDNQTHYETKCDIFSAGAIFYRLCIHKPLFDGTTHAEVLQQNKQMKFSLQTQQFKELLPLAQDLLKQMLQVDPLKRINAFDALNHKFFQFTMEHEENHISPYQGDLQSARIQIKEEKKINKDISEKTTLKTNKPLITGKIKPILPEKNVTQRGSFDDHHSSQFLKVPQEKYKTRSLRGSGADKSKERKLSGDCSLLEKDNKNNVINTQKNEKFPTQTKISQGDNPANKVSGQRRVSLQCNSQLIVHFPQQQQKQGIDKTKSQLASEREIKKK